MSIPYSVFRIPNWIALLLLAQALVASEQQPQQPPPQPTFRVEANYVRVDVYPTLNSRIVADLTRDDFEIFEDGAPQKIDSFARVVARGPGPQSTRVDPNTSEQARDMAADPRNRVFVLFLDTYHTRMVSSRQVSPPIARMLQRAIGQDDLVAAMTPEMSARDVTFARRLDALETILAKKWWGRRDRNSDRDPQEVVYETCFPKESQKWIVAEMIARRREKLVLDALQDLVRHLRGIREERKGVFVISEGWRLFRPNPNLMKMEEGDPVPGTPEIFVGPDGKLTTKDTRRFTTSSRYECERDRMNLANLDNEQHFREMLGEANRANASFYPVDPRGLPAFASDIGPDQPPPIHIDQQILRDSLTVLRTLADATDGIAVMNSNDIAGGLERVVNDLASYYLLGYYSTNTKLDGKFRNIKVRVRRPGIHVRARRGYRAATQEEISRESGAGTGAGAPAAPSAIERALGRLAGLRSEERFRIRATPLPRAEGDLSASLWVTGELDYFAAKSADWKNGGEVEITLSTSEGRPLASTRAPLAAGARTLLAKLSMPPGSEFDGSGRVIARMRSPSGGLPLTATVHVTWPEEPDTEVSEPLLFRRGPITAHKYEPAVDLRFRRGEHVRVQIPVTGQEPSAAGRILDRRGQPLQVPVSTSVHRDPDGATWIVAEASLGPLAPADYAVEVTLKRGEGAAQQVLVPIRIVP